MKTTKLFKTSGNTPRGTDLARTSPAFMTRCVARNFDGTVRHSHTSKTWPVFAIHRAVIDLLTKMCFPLQVTSSKLASRTTRPNSGGDRNGVNRVATSKPSTSSCLTLLLRREGRVEPNRFHSYGNAADIAATRFVSDKYNPNRDKIGVWIETISRVLHPVAGASWVLTKNCVCNCRFNPSLVSIPIVPSPSS